MKTQPDILVFEDSEDDFSLIVDRLGAARVQHRPIQVRTRNEFLGRLRVEAPSAILADVASLCRDITATVRDARELKPDAPMILLAAPETESLAMEGLEAGAADYVMKPRFNRLASTVRRALNECSRAEQNRLLADQLAVQEDVYRSLVDNVPYQIFRKDKEGRFTFANRRFSELVGRPLADIIGQRDEDFFPGDFARKYRDDDDRVIRTGRMLETVEQNLAPGGETRIVKVVKVPVMNAAGETVGVQGMFWDLTETRRSEERIARQILVLDRVRDAILECGADGAISYWNRAAEKLYQRSAAEVMGRNIIDVLGVGRDFFLKVWRELLVTGHWRGEMAQQCADGSQLRIECHCTLVRNATGGVESLILVNTDVTGHRRLEERLTALNSLRNQDLNACGIAHDLNNVLTPVLAVAGQLRLLLGGEPIDPRSIERAVAVVDESVRTGRALVAKLKPGKDAAPKQPCAAPGEVVKELADYFRETFPPTVAVLAEVNEALPGVVVDETEFRRLLLNLAVNAREAMPRGGRLRIGACSTEVDEAFVEHEAMAGPGAYVRLSVEDNGTGIAPGIQGQIFKPYFTTRREDGGDGVGLAIVSRIVDDAGGFVRVTSRRGEGSRFDVYLPVVRPAVGGPESGDRGEDADRRRTVLLVDDTPVLLTIGTAMLATYSFDVLTAGDGQEALSLFMENPDRIDLIVTDMRMPLLDGLGLVRELRRQGHGTPVIVMTGMDVRKEFTELSDYLGVRHFLAKPFSQHEFVGKVHEALGMALPT